ncbi:MAG: hypothetical protein ACR2NP_10170 [Pirellulaceae bacterium]
MARKTPKKRTRKTTAESPLIPIDCDSEVVRRRLARIESNYDLLDEMLADLEARVPGELSASPGEGNPNKPR